MNAPASLLTRQGFIGYSPTVDWLQPDSAGKSASSKRLLLYYQLKLPTEALAPLGPIATVAAVTIARLVKSIH